MTRATNQEFEAWKADCIANPSKLDALPRSVAQMWRKQWGIDATDSQSFSIKILAKGDGFSLQFDEQSSINQVMEFAFQLQKLRNAEVINDEILLTGSQYIASWLFDNNMSWDLLLSVSKAKVAS